MRTFLIIAAVLMVAGVAWAAPVPHTATADTTGYRIHGGGGSIAWAEVFAHGDEFGVIFHKLDVAADSVLTNYPASGTYLLPADVGRLLDAPRWFPSGVVDSLTVYKLNSDADSLSVVAE